MRPSAQDIQHLIDAMKSGTYVAYEALQGYNLNHYDGKYNGLQLLMLLDHLQSKYELVDRLYYTNLRQLLAAHIDIMAKLGLEAVS